MSHNSNDYGRAYEFACLHSLQEELQKFRSVKILPNSSYEAAKGAWNSTPDELKAALMASSQAAVDVLLDCEPIMTERSHDDLTLKLQLDSKGQDGDVRDIIIARSGLSWEIGLSLKHNHKAVKHSRLGEALDFGKKWYGIPCSQEYWSAVDSIFKRLSRARLRGELWRDMVDKEANVYVLLLRAFVDEVNRQAVIHAEVPHRLTEYLLGIFDFYKVVSIDREKATYVTPYNIHGNLNKTALSAKPKLEIAKLILPNHILACDLMPGTSNTAFMAMDNGWQFSFRIHNASSYVEPSLKFDIQLKGWPITLITIKRLWKRFS